MLILPMKSLKLKMIFKFGMTVIVLVAIILFFLGQREVENRHESEKGFEVAKYGLSGESVIKEEQVKDSNQMLNQKVFNIKADTKDFEEAVLKQTAAYKVKRILSKSIHLCVVACGERFDEITILLKSAILFTSSHLVIHIFAEPHLQKGFKDHLEFWPQTYRSQISYQIYDIVYPPGEDVQKWKSLFKPCASQRLFIPELLPDVDSLIYVDTDVIFSSSIDKLHKYFSKFNDSQLVALVPESEDLATGWYNRFARHPYYGLFGVNSGVMLMNLTRIRQSKWLPSILKYYKEYNLQITWGDQDLINIYFHYYPEQLYILTCEWNFRPDHCMYMSVCKTAESEGVKILHGSRRVFFSEKQPAFRAVYTALKEHKFTSSIQFSLLTKIKRLLKETEYTNCGKISHIFTKQIELYSLRELGTNVTNTRNDIK